MSDYLDRRLAVWLNTYRDNKFLYDELTARTADKWLDDYSQDKPLLDEMCENLRKNLLISSSSLHEIFGDIKEKLSNGNMDF